MRIDWDAGRIRNGYWTTHTTIAIVAGMSEGRRLVLVADDDAGVRDLLRSALERNGHQVDEAGSAAEVFARLDEHQPDVLLLDVHLGPDDGLALGVGLRREKQYRGLKVVFMTGTLDQPELVRLSRLWKVPILAKPFDFAALAEAIG